jgi:hypothetical protein
MKYLAYLNILFGDKKLRAKQWKLQKKGERP